MSEYAELKERLLEVQGGKLYYTNTKNSLRLESAVAIDALERRLKEAQQARDAAEARAKRLEGALRKIESGLPAGVMTFDKNHVIWRDGYMDLQRIARAALKGEPTNE